MKTLLSFRACLAACGLMAFSSAQAGEYVVDKGHSSIQVDVKATGHDFTANLKNYQIKITGDSGSATPSAVNLTWDFKDLATGDTKRDKEMLEWMEHSKKPGGSFTLSSFSKDAKGQQIAKGKLTIHGITKEIQIPVSINRQGNRLAVSGAVRFDHTNFGLKKYRKLAILTVDTNLTVRFTLQGTIR